LFIVFLVQGAVHVLHVHVLHVHVLHVDMLHVDVLHVHVLHVHVLLGTTPIISAFGKQMFALIWETCD